MQKWGTISIDSEYRREAGEGGTDHRERKSFIPLSAAVSLCCTTFGPDLVMDAQKDYFPPKGGRFVFESSNGTTLTLKFNSVQFIQLNSIHFTFDGFE